MIKSINAIYVAIRKIPVFFDMLFLNLVIIANERQMILRNIIGIKPTPYVTSYGMGEINATIPGINVNVTTIFPRRLSNVSLELLKTLLIMSNNGIISIKLKTVKENNTIGIKYVLLMIDNVAIAAKVLITIAIMESGKRNTFVGLVFKNT